MSKTYRPWKPTQSWLLSPLPRDWLDEGDLVYFLLDNVMELDQFSGSMPHKLHQIVPQWLNGFQLLEVVI